MWDEESKKHIGSHDLRPESLMMSFGYSPALSEGAAKPPIFQTSTFVFSSAEEGKAFFEVAYGLREKRPAESTGLIYSRLNNPGLEILEDRLTLWDGAEAAAVFQSGMAAISTTILTFVRPGDVVAFPEPVYGGTEFLLHHILPEFGIETVCFPATEDVAGLERVLSEGDRKERLRLVIVETPANPTNALVDIEAFAAVAGTSGREGRPALLAVDNTFLGPLYQHPLRLGADLVLYSLTKYVGGHSDLIAGACLGAEELVVQVKTTRTIFGTMAGPWTSWLLLRSLETLKLRMTSQMKNARYVADFLAQHPRVQRVHYLGHLEEGDPQFRIYRKQCLSPGAMISFEIVGGEAEAFRVLDALELIKLAVSLGGTESLAEHPATMTHADVPPEDQLDMGITPALIRLSVGIEHPEDLIADLEQALEKV
ncbi:MAG TPA: cystathionine gamma-synthase family protein [Longimicrobiales bacterium]|nr:cystathionine gamma-synthase family protein [Longimicrobiales bacterium]